MPGLGRAVREWGRPRLSAELRKERGAKALGWKNERAPYLGAVVPHGESIEGAVRRAADEMYWYEAVADASYREADAVGEEKPGDERHRGAHVTHHARRVAIGDERR
jgi:hypothetical protein